MWILVLLAGEGMSETTTFVARERSRETASSQISGTVHTQSIRSLSWLAQTASSPCFAASESSCCDEGMVLARLCRPSILAFMGTESCYTHSKRTLSVLRVAGGRHAGGAGGVMRPRRPPAVAEGARTDCDCLNTHTHT
jgi:hypothetical protein